MYAVSISLGASNAHVAVANLPNGADVAAAPPTAPIRVLVNSSGHRQTPLAAAFADTETLFGENAIHYFARQPQKVVPYLFSYASVAACLTDARSADDEEQTLDQFLQRVVDQASQKKYKSHCPFDEEPGTVAEKARHGFQYDVPVGDDTVDKFVSAEDLFVQFLNYLKEHCVDGACGLSGGNENTPAEEAKGLYLTLVVPRYSFPGLFRSAPTAATENPEEELAENEHRAVGWLLDAVQSSAFDSVVVHTTVIFSDEASLLAFDSAPSSLPKQQHFLLPPNAVTAGSTVSPIAEANVLVVDWGAHSLSLSLLRTRGGVLLEGDVDGNGHHEYLCSTAVSSSTLPDAVAADSFFSRVQSCGGDAIDVALADRVTAHFVNQQRRMFTGQVRNMGQLTQYSQRLMGDNRDDSIGRIVAELIPARAARRLRMLMEEKKIALNTNLQAAHVAVELEAFYEGMDLLDNQTMSRNKIDAAMRSDWGLVEMFEKVLQEFVGRFSSALAATPVNYVVLTGGMCQMPFVVSGLRKLLTERANAWLQGAVAPTVTVLDASAVGNGTTADELACVGGCLHSYQLALIDRLTKFTLKASRAKKAASKALQQQARHETHTALERAWQWIGRTDVCATANAMTVAETLHVPLLRRNLYVYCGASVPSVSDTDCTCTLPAADLHVLMAINTPLPSQVAIPLSSSGQESVGLFFFVDSAPGATAQAAVEGTVLVSFLGLHQVSAEANSMAVVSLEAKPSEDDANHTHALVLNTRTVRVGSEGNLPVLLTPANIICNATPIEVLLS